MGSRNGLTLPPDSVEFSLGRIMENPDPATYLDHCPFIDWDSHSIRQQASKLSGHSVHLTTQNCFEFVRDEIKHSVDHRLGPVTCCASDVLKFRTGFCYAKSHLLCALLRSNRIPAGLCYQRLRVDDDSEQFCLHGLNAAFLPEIGWYRLDPRGNQAGIDAQFTPPEEKLAFATGSENEFDLPGIYARPLPEVVNCLMRQGTWEQVAACLPDLSIDQEDSAGSPKGNRRG